MLAADARTEERVAQRRRQRWLQRDCVRLLETGFGLGNNCLATWAAWRQDPQRCDRLFFISIEKHPLRPADLVRRLHGDEHAQHHDHGRDEPDPPTADLGVDGVERRHLVAQLRGEAVGPAVRQVVEAGGQQAQGGGRVVAALNVSGQLRRTSAAAAREILLPALREAAQEVSALVGSRV